ncbi:alpha/beta hydrolase [Bacteroidota bacterium]
MMRKNTIIFKLIILLLFPFAAISTLAQKADSCIWVVTNRVIDSENENNVNFGSYISPDKQLSFIEACICEKENWVYQSKNDFTDLLSDINPYEDIVVFVHGDHKNFDDAVFRALEIHREHNVNVILFTWPSKLPDKSGIKNFKNSQKNVDLSIDNFVELLVLIQEYKAEHPEITANVNFSLFHHSLGNRFILKMIQGDKDKVLEDKLFNNLVLNAAAVNQEGHKVWVDQIQFAENIYITSNKSDFNLNGARLFSKQGKQLGERIKPPLSENANYINFTKAVGFKIATGTSHTYFIGSIPEKNPKIKSFYSDLFHGKKVDLQNTKMYQLNKKGLGYDILKK